MCLSLRTKEELYGTHEEINKEGGVEAIDEHNQQHISYPPACFGLGRYLYYFDGVRVDLDERKRPKTSLKLFGWATPEGWHQGLRPQPVAGAHSDGRAFASVPAAEGPTDCEKNLWFLSRRPCGTVF